MYDNFKMWFNLRNPFSFGDNKHLMDHVTGNLSTYTISISIPIYNMDKSWILNVDGLCLKLIANSKIITHDYSTVCTNRFARSVQNVWHQKAIWINNKSSMNNHYIIPRFPLNFHRIHVDPFISIRFGWKWYQPKKKTAQWNIMRLKWAWIRVSIN